MCIRDRYVIRVVCCFSLLVSMTALPFIHRSIYHKMHEVEASSLFSSMRLLLAKLILLGIGDVLILSMILLVTAIRTSIFTDSLLLYLLFPFLLASSGAVFLLRHLSAEHYIGGSLVFYGFLLILFLMSDGLWPVLYQQTFSAGWIAVCAGLAAFCIWQFSSLARQSSYAELQLTWPKRYFTGCRHNAFRQLCNAKVKADLLNLLHILRKDGTNGTIYWSYI